MDCSLVAYQAPLSMGFSRQECWSGLPLPSPGDPPDPGIEPRSHRKYSVIANYYDNYNHEVSKIPYLILISAKLSLRKQTCSNTDFQIFKTRTYGKEL